jgi:integrase
MLKSTDNQTLREFVDELVDKELSPRSIRDILLVAKLILKSATDSRGNPLYRWEFNHDYINAPVVGAANAPCASREAIEEAVRVPKYGMLFAVLGATGFRIGEALALRIGDNGQGTCWDQTASVIHVRQSIWRGSLQAPKTIAAIRSVDLCAQANEAISIFAGNRTEGFLFESRNKTPLSATTVYRFGLSKTKIPGAHSLRRFRATRLAEAEVPMPLIKMWLGHSKNDISENYMRPSEMASRRDWCEKAGLGFSL